MSKRKSPKYAKFIRVLFVLIMTAALVLPTFADTASDLEDAKSLKTQLEEQVAESEAKLEELTASEAELEAHIIEIDTEIAEITALIDEYESQMDDISMQIDALDAQIEAEEADIEDRYEKMKYRIQYMYENLGDSYVEAIFSSKTVGELLQKLQYIFDLNEYDSDMMDQLEALIEQLETNQSEMETEFIEIEALDAAQEEQKSVLQELYESKYSELVSTQADIESTNSEISTIRAEIDETNEKITELTTKYEEEEAAKKAAEEAAAKAAAEEKKSSSSSSSSSSTSSGSTSKTISGSGTGVDVINYGLKYLGAPYKLGGYSWTSGIDCSGFVKKVYEHFGVYLPHQSYKIRKYGVAVEPVLSEMKPGDIICYNGHVGLYYGDGKVLHASGSGCVKIGSNWKYRSVWGVRRIFDS